MLLLLLVLLVLLLLQFDEWQVFMGHVRLFQFLVFLKRCQAENIAKQKNIEAYRIIRDLLPATSMSLMPLQ